MQAMKLAASAPGKLVLSGEYAVLFGAPAIAVAVNRRARVRISDSNADHHTVTAPGFASAPGRFQVDDGDFTWLDGNEDFALLEMIWSALDPKISGHLALELDTRPFRDTATGSKLGIGSSAALAAALTHALAQAGEEAKDASRAAVDGHRQFQGGLGSGVDVACGVLGGLVEYSMGEKGARHLDWPDGLHMAVFWLGVPVSTAERLGRLLEQPSRPSREALVQTSGRAAAAWSEGSAQDILAAYPHYVGILRKFSADYGLGIFDAGHGELSRLAESMGVVYKPCGAGGGDCGVCLSDNSAAIDAFIDGAEARHAYRPDIGIDHDGVRVRSEAA